MSTTPEDFGTRLTRLEAVRQGIRDSIRFLDKVEPMQRQMHKAQAEYEAARQALQEQGSSEQERLNSDTDKRIAEILSILAGKGQLDLR